MPRATTPRMSAPCFGGLKTPFRPTGCIFPSAITGAPPALWVSGTPVIRPHGQLKGPDHDLPAYLPSRRFDFELEMGAIIGQPSTGPISVDAAFGNIFGYVIPQ